MIERLKTVGVIGGMGPEATVDFMAKVIALTPAEKDQDHVRMLVDNNPKVPNRQAAILADGEDPGPELAAMAARLEVSGADFLVIPCNTAYVFGDAVSEAVRIPLISIIDVTVAAVIECCAAKVGILATEGCLRAGLYQAALAEAGLELIAPTDDELATFTSLIHRIKVGEQDDAVSDAMVELANALVERGAESIIVGCTEVPLVLTSSMLDVPLISSTGVLAQETVLLALGEKALPDKEP
ncbi:MAG: amino acid racemase [Woeseiaceae bacterium]|jgi:aspartate racemase